VDVLVVNKADGDLAAAAGRAASDYRHALRLLHPLRRSWEPRVVVTSAVEGTGIAELWEAIRAFRAAVEASGELEETRARQAVAWLWSELDETLRARFREDPEVRKQLPVIEEEVAG